MANEGVQPPPGTPWRPVPDPTELTTQALLREVAALRELLELSIEDLKDVLDEKFLRTEQQFELVERQRVEQKKDTKDAVDAALTAQKEAVREQTAASERAIAKSEAATSKQLEQLSVTFSNATASQQRELGEVKERVTTIESVKTGATESRAGVYALVASGISVLVLIVAAIGLLVSTQSPA
jgi:dGTP triphosphohydrolase